MMPENREFLSRFAAAPGLAVALMLADGTILYVNETITRLYGGGTVEEHTGSNLADLYPREWAEEKIALLRRVAETDDRLMIRYIWEGKRIEAQYQRIPAEEEGGEPRILVTVREGTTEGDLVPEGYEVVKMDTAHFGPLSVLTPRELEVLALIGHGKSAKEIAELLGCSPRTVERHRDSIGKKLDKNDRVSLALIAQAAGLELRDARVKHVGPATPKSSTASSTQSGSEGRAATPTPKPTSQTEVKPDQPKASPRD